MSSEFDGIYIAFYACYDKNGDISVENTQRLANYYIGKGVRGLYLTGSSGEGMMQSTSERKLVYRSVSEAVGGKLKLIAHVGAPSTGEAVELAGEAKRCGLNAVSSVPNIYYKASEGMIERHWDAIMAASELPFIMYNTPGATGTDISANLFEKMLKKPHTCGIKHTGVSTAQINLFRRMAGDDFVIYNGNDSQLLAGLVMGASGGIGGTYGYMPEVYVNIYNAFKAGDIVKAQKWQTRSCTMIDIMGKTLKGNNGAAFSKAVLARRGMDIGGARYPILPMDPNEPNVIASAQMIEDWLSEND